MGLPTPNHDHLRTSRFRNRVYDPAEDTFLLLDALEEERIFLKQLNPTICLEIGSGSGCVITFLATLLGKSNALYLATDINPLAALATTFTATANTCNVDSIHTYAAKPFASRLAQNVDVLVFNPPYVVTASNEVGSTGIEAAWAGGIDGREVIDKVIPGVENLLSPTGVFYLVTVKENRPAEIASIMMSKYGLDSKVIARRSVGIEGLGIMKFWRRNLAA